MLRLGAQASRQNSTSKPAMRTFSRNARSSPTTSFSRACSRIGTPSAGSKAKKPLRFGPASSGGCAPRHMRDVNLLLEQPVLIIGVGDQDDVADRNRWEAPPDDYAVGVLVAVL
jgi:hypothetical protein